ncbi:MAG TPA: hypothetical protein VFH31_01555 [Pyrinomonadaceae bacterium]|nr:hypothetical protein [Pyrinomonadaceae bacterium]
MKRNILRGFTMLTLIVTVAFVTAVASANAQSRAVVANIPFEFTVGEKALPTGQYMVRAATQGSNAMVVENRRSGKAAIRLSNPIHKLNASEETKLVFHRYGARYFLAEIWVGGETSGCQLLKSKEEKTIESQLAAIFPKGEQSSYDIVEVVASLR